MADKILKSIKFPGLEDPYVIPDPTDEIDAKVSEAETDMLSVLSGATAVQTLSNNTPYLFRQTPKAGHSEFDTLVGGSVAWNQLIQPSMLPPTDSDIRNNGDGSVTLLNTASSDIFKIFSTFNTIIANHVYLLDNGLNFYDTTIFGESGICNTVVKAQSGGTPYTERVYIPAGTPANTVFRPMFTDLTQAFGSTVADAIYAMEQATAGSGVAYFRSLFGEDYYAYNAGELMSVSGVSAHNMTGFNQWDEEWEEGMINDNTGQPETNPLHDVIRSKNFSKALPNTSYYGMSANNTKRLVVLWYDSQYGFIGRSVVGNNASATSPANASYFKMRTADDYGGVYKHDICINLSDTAKNGTYEPYEIHSYPLDNSLTLRGIPKWNNGLYYDGDVYEADGTVSRKYGIVDFGTLNWNYVSNKYFQSATISSDIKGADQTQPANFLAQGYRTIAWNDSTGVSMDIAVNENGLISCQNASYTSASAFKTAMSGVYAVYELKTITTETADPYQKAQICDPSGTEEYVSTSIVPVGHETEYPMTITDIAPTSNGTYTLNCTVSGGVATYEWVSE